MTAERVSVVDKGSYWYCFLDLSVMRDKELSVCDKATYAALCTFVSGGAPDAGCFPSLESVAERASCSRRKVIDCIKTLEERGYIKVQRRAEKRKSSVYYLTRKRDDVVNKVHRTSEPDAPVEKEGCTSFTSEVHHVHLTSECGAPEEESRNIKSLKESSGDGDDSTPPSGRNEKPPREEGDILPAPSEDDLPRDLSPLERKILGRIKPVMASKYHVAKDRDYLRRLMTDYAELDIDEVMEDWATWAESKYGTLAKKQNPHSQWRTFCRNARSEGRHILVDYRDSPRTGGRSFGGGKPGKQEVDLAALKEKYGGFVQ